MGRTSLAFTLIELLVVVTVIVVLLALLAPALDKAVSAAGTARCLANQHSIGQALALYLGDYKQKYPVITNWFTLMGGLGSANTADQDVTHRPLNRYLGYTGNGTRVPVAQCPADNGDPSSAQYHNMYAAAGTSYIPAYMPLNFEPKGYAGVKMVFGHVGGLDPYWGINMNSRSAPVPSARHTSLSSTHNKVINADWNWHANRPTASERTRWHRPDSPERLLSTLFADSHAELFDWDKQWMEDYNNNVSTPNYDPSWRWW